MTRRPRCLRGEQLALRRSAKTPAMSTACGGGSRRHRWYGRARWSATTGRRPSFKTRPVRRGRRGSVAEDRRGDSAGASPPARELLSAADVTRTIARIAHQIIEKTAGAEDLVLIGIPTRGTILARRLAAAIGEFAGTAPAVGSVDPTLYRDDLRRRPARALEDTAVPEGGVDDKLVVLV